MPDLSEREAIENRLAEISERLKKIDEDLKKDPIEETQKIYDAVFERWHVGRDWIHAIQARAAETCRVISPLFRPRHLFAYLHPAKVIRSAMARRGPNSIIQGLSSDVNGKSARLLQRLVWHYVQRHGHLWTHVQNNTVHDSAEDECKILELPLAAYLREHAMTTMVHRDFEKIGQPLPVDYDIDIEIGPTLGGLYEWDLRADTLLELIVKSMEWQEKENQRKYRHKEKMIAALEHNIAILRELRDAEIIAALQDQEDNPNAPASRHFFLTHDFLITKGYVFHTEKFDESDPL